ncbi:hypothetical protein D9M68_987720 [compost metagenome]
MFRHQSNAEAGDIENFASDQLLAVEADLPLPWADDAKDAAQGGGLACAVAPQQRYQFASLNLERDTFKHMALVVVGMDRIDVEHQAASPR